MAIQYSTTHRTNAVADIATQAGINAVIKIFSGTPPANCATADTGLLLVTFAGNATQFGTTASGLMTASIVANATAGNAGTAGYFRVYPSAATTTNAVFQGTVAMSGGDMTVTNTSIALSQTCTFGPLTVQAFGA